MPRKKTETRVKRTVGIDPIKCTEAIAELVVWAEVIESRNRDLEARLKAAEAECKRLKRKCDVLARQKENWQRIVTAPRRQI